jgi:hypothetical protein
MVKLGFFHACFGAGQHPVLKGYLLSSFFFRLPAPVIFFWCQVSFITISLFLLNWRRKTNRRSKSTFGAKVPTVENQAAEGNGATE